MIQLHLILSFLISLDPGAGASTSLLPDLVQQSSPVIDPVDPEEYVLGPGDVLWVASVGGLPSEFSPVGSSSSVFYTSITPDGFVLLPLLGSIEVTGLTLAEGSALVESVMRSRLNGVRPEVGLAQTRASRVAVSGMVTAPRIVTVKGTDRVSDVLLAAGGAAPGAMLSDVCIIGLDGDTIRVDLIGYYMTGDFSSNPLLRPGDRVYVHAAPGTIRVEGAINVRGLYSMEYSEEYGWPESAGTVLEYIEGETAGMALARAGTPTPWALPESLEVVRTAADGGTASIRGAGTLLQPGDRVICPGEPLTVAVSGQVEAPGTYPYVAGRDAFYYIAQAGGFMYEASRSGARVVTDGVGVPLEDAPPPAPGSVIEVPRKTLVWWQEPFTILTGLASIIIAWASIN